MEECLRKGSGGVPEEGECIGDVLGYVMSQGRRREDCVSVGEGGGDRR